jgi:hypothetical protein
MPTQTLLYLGASPIDAEPLDHSYELSQIKKALKSSAFGSNVNVQVDLGVSANDFASSVIRHQPQILHLSFHGDIDGIFYKSDKDGTTQKIPVEAWRSLGAALSPAVKVIMFNCCYSSDIAKELVDSIDFLVAMKEEISDQAAADFAATFYASLFAGDTVQQAFDYGVAQIASQNNAEEDIPELITRKDASQARFCSNLVFGDLNLSGTAINALIRENDNLVEVRAHYCGESGIKANFDLTSLLAPDLKIEQLFVQVDDYSPFECVETYFFHAMQRSNRKYKCSLLPKVGRYISEPTDKSYDYLSMSCDEIESFVMEINSHATGFYKFRIGISYSQGGQMKELFHPSILKLYFFDRGLNPVGKAKTSILEQSLSFLFP